MTILENIAGLAAPAADLMQYGAYAIGIMLVGRGMLSAMQAGHDSRHITCAVSDWATGGGLMAFAYIVSVTVESVTGSQWDANISSAMTYWGTGSDTSGKAISSALTIVQLVGYAGVLKGILLFNRAGHSGGQKQALADHPATVAFMHLFLGSLAINAKPVLSGLANLLNITPPGWLG